MDGVNGTVGTISGTRRRSSRKSTDGHTIAINIKVLMPMWLEDQRRCEEKAEELRR